MIASFSPWGGADGTNQWDKNKSGAPFYSGTATGGGNLSVTVSGAGWSSNQWAGYSIKKSDGRFSYINSNTSGTIIYQDSAGYGSNLSFDAGDRFVINKVEQSIDQPGVGQSNLLSGDQPTRPADWNQVADPCYMWGNTNDGAPFNTFAVNQANVKAGRALLQQHCVARIHGVRLSASAGKWQSAAESNAKLARSHADLHAQALGRKAKGGKAGQKTREKGQREPDQ